MNAQATIGTRREVESPTPNITGFIEAFRTSEIGEWKRRPGYLPENIRLRNAFNNSPSQLRGERELSLARQR
jgi:hypothetical protein